jgi:hypothetical protein
MSKQVNGPGVIERAQQDVVRGDLAGAAQRLRSYIGSKGYDEAVCRQLGEVCARMGDPHQAGMWFMLCGGLNQEEERLVAGFVNRFSGDGSAVASQWPRKLRATRVEVFTKDARERLEQIGWRGEVVSKVGVGGDTDVRAWKAWVVIGVVVTALVVAGMMLVRWLG